MSREALGFGAVKTGRVLYALVRDMAAASRIVKVPQRCIFSRGFDRAQTLLEQALKENPFGDPRS